MASFQSKEWLKAAYGDLRSIEHIVKDDFLTHIVAFHSQQAIEKSLKAAMEDKSISISKIHKLETLISRIDIDINFDSEIIEILDLLYIESRYPGDIGLLPHGKPTLKDAKEFYDFAEGIFNQVCELLSVKMQEIKS